MQPNRQFPPQRLPPGSSADALSEAPAGTIVVVGPEGGYAMPSGQHKLLFGRGRGNVHVAVGVDDPNVSRRHGEFTCTGPGGEWYFSNIGKRLPIEMPDGTLLLPGHGRIFKPGHTRLVIHSVERRSHLVEVRLAGRDRRRTYGTPDEKTEPPEPVYKLSDEERLVLTALAQRYLEGYDDYPLPLTWGETARVANDSPKSAREWTNKMAGHTVKHVRERLHRQGVRGLTRDQVGTPVGSTLSVNLIRELIKTSTLSTKDLDLLSDSE
jgi:hypothetical protein